MAADKHHDVSAMDYAEHDKTFGLFGSMIKWGTVFSLLFVLIVGAATSTISWPFALIVGVLLTVITAKFF
jgi:Bacterial aa3 type cytochrome c oxidase subunit IV